MSESKISRITVAAIIFICLMLSAPSWADDWTIAMNGCWIGQDAGCGLTTNWPNDEARATAAECKAAHEWRFDKWCEINVRLNRDVPTYFILTDGSRVEFGLRSDGVVTWRKVK